MSEALTVLNNNQPTALAVGGGFGLDSRLFKLKPGTLEIVQRTTKQDGAIPGKLRVTQTNEHFDEMRVVLLINPQEQRQYFPKGAKMERDSKACFSLDNIQPHPRAKDPQAINCAVCTKGDINWKKWRETKNSNDLPPCQKYWHLFVADRQTQMAYYLNLKGKSVMPFEQAMQNMARLFASLEANVKAANAKKGFSFNPKTRQFSPTPGVTIPEGVTADPLPNIFDISFTMYVKKDAGGDAFVFQAKEFKALLPEARAEFGALVEDFLNRRANGQVVSQEEVEAENDAKEANAAVSEQSGISADSSPNVKAVEVQAVVGGQAVVGEIVGKDEPITI